MLTRKPSTAGAAVGVVAALVRTGSALAFSDVTNGSFEAGAYQTNPAFWQTKSATGSPPVTYTYNNAGNTRASMNWVNRLYSFTATAANTTLRFTSATAGVFGPAIDDVRVHQVAGSKDDCKKGSWQSLVDEWGNTFTNQGDCVSYVATGGRNPGAGGAP